MVWVGLKIGGPIRSTWDYILRKACLAWGYILRKHELEEEARCKDERRNNRILWHGGTVHVAYDHG